MRAAGVPFRTISASEHKPVARRFIAAKASVEHVFKDMLDQSNGEGYCFTHARKCKLADEAPDFACGGLLCQPFTRARRWNGSTPKESSTHEHPGFRVVDSVFKDYLARRKPKGFLVEESCGMLETDQTSGETYLDGFMDGAASLGYAVRALRLDHGVWCEQPRDRQVVWFTFLIPVVSCFCEALVFGSVRCFVSALRAEAHWKNQSRFVAHLSVH